MRRIIGIALVCLCAGMAWGQGLTGTGIETYQKIGSSTMLHGLQEFTITMWVNVTSYLQGGRILFTRNAGGETSSIGFAQYSSSGTVTCYNNRVGYADSTVTSIGYSTWVHLGYTWNSKTQTGGMYKNGVLVQTVSPTLNRTTYQNARFTWLSDMADWQRRTSGSTADMRFYSRSLSGGEMSAIFRHPHLINGKSMLYHFDGIYGRVPGYQLAVGNYPSRNRSSHTFEVVTTHNQCTLGTSVSGARPMMMMGM